MNENNEIKYVVLMWATFEKWKRGLGACKGEVNCSFCQWATCHSLVEYQRKPGSSALVCSSSKLGGELVIPTVSRQPC